MNKGEDNGKKEGRPARSLCHASCHACAPMCASLPCISAITGAVRRYGMIQWLLIESLSLSLGLPRRSVVRLGCRDGLLHNTAHVVTRQGE